MEKPLIKRNVSFINNWGSFCHFMVVMIVAEVNALEVIGKLDEPKGTSSVMETINVNGFHVLP